MAYSIDALTDDCYPNTAVLINKLGIKDDAALAEVEAEIVSARAGEWANLPRTSTFDFAHYKAVHSYLFSDLYDWAGQVRTVNLSKNGTSFCQAAQIEETAVLLFGRLKRLHFFQELSHSDFIEELTDFYCATNNLHPFREGNGRTQRVFLSQLMASVGYTLHFSEIDNDLLMFATIQAAQGVTDLLQKLLDEAITAT